jgi:ABC-type nickel/cobalt efflux system permease component RcnA
MEPTNTELSSRTAAIFSWLEFLGIVLIILSATVFKTYRDWLQLIAFALLLSGFIYRILRDWRAGRKKAARFRIIVLAIIIIALGVLIAVPLLKE